VAKSERRGDHGEREALTKTYVMDASVLVALNHKNDDHYVEVTAWFDSLSGEDVYVAPTLILAEMSAAFGQCGLAASIIERTHAAVKASFEFLELTEDRSKGAGQVAYSTRCRAADAVYVQAAQEKKATLVTADKKQAKAARDLDINVVLFGDGGDASRKS